MLLLDFGLFIFLLLLTTQGMISLYISLYVWEDPERLEHTASPKTYEKPRVSFTALLPAKDEKAVIGRTISQLAAANYPQSLFEILVICQAIDIKTIEAARMAISDGKIKNARVVIFNKPPFNKPHHLNIGLTEASKKVITIFDAEDDVNPDIFNIANTIYLRNKPDIIQAGVQLMDYSSHWYSPHNVLEYFFWFKSRMHYQAKAGMVPLGGNTVFFKTNQLRRVKGWDETCLTEDGEIGIRMTLRGAKVHATYDARHITKEETPDTAAAFIKQRTRWNQGFLQILRKGEWRRFKTRKQRWLCLYTLSFPIVQAILLMATPVLLFIGITSKPPVVLSLFSFVPLLIVLIQLMVNWIALYEFSREQKLPLKPLAFSWLLFGFLPYQLMLGASALRALYREIKGVNNWEKTAHLGLHREIGPIVRSSSRAGKHHTTRAGGV